MSKKNTEGTLHESMIFFFVFVCRVSASADNLLKFFSRYFLKLTDASNLPRG